MKKSQKLARFVDIKLKRDIATYCFNSDYSKLNEKRNNGTQVDKIIRNFCVFTRPFVLKWVRGGDSVPWGSIKKAKTSLHNQDVRRTWILCGDRIIRPRGSAEAEREQ